MSQPSEIAARFDRVSEVYDETREPLTPEALDKIASVLSKDGSKRILEVGVGTGRIAKPLQQRRFDVQGVDLSKGMLQKAKDKGVENLALADANNLPFIDEAFDAVLMSHVLHLLEDPVATFRRVRRVARREVVVLLRKRDEATAESDARTTVWREFRKAAEEAGYSSPWASETWRDRFRREAELISTIPPTELITIEDRSGVTTLGQRVSAIEKRAYGYPGEIPDDVFRRVVNKLKSTVDLEREVSYRRVELMSIWRLGQ